MRRAYRLLAAGLLATVAMAAVTWSGLRPAILDTGHGTDSRSAIGASAKWHDPGAGGPIAVIRNETFPQFGDSYGEVLRAEGISSYAFTGIRELESLTRFRIAILPETTVTPSQAQALAAWVHDGGTLFVMRPTDELATLAGLSPTSGSMEDGKYKVYPPHWGRSDMPLQFHGTADLRTPVHDVQTAAALARRDGTPLAYPAITIRRDIGPGSGTVVSFLFDVGRSIVLTRQGDPRRVGQPRQLDPYMPRASEFFAGPAGDIDSAFLDMSLFEIPQADVLQRLFVGMLQSVGERQIPLPRFWYLPSGRKAAIVMTSDDHNADRTADFFDELLSPAHSPAGCSAREWTCARATSWVYGRVEALKKPGVLRRYLKAGFEVGPHLAIERDGPCAAWQDIDRLFASFAERQREFRRDYGIAPTPTGRSHCYLFSDWDAEVRVQRQLGIRLDANYTAYGLPGWRNRLGRINGSGIPIRFASRDGSLHDVYQFSSDFSSDDFTEATAEQTRDALKKALDRTAGPRGFWGFIGTHFDFSEPGERVRHAILAEVSERNKHRPVDEQVAMISARQLLDWLDLRNRSAFTDLTFDGERLSFSLQVDDSLPNPGLEAMLPVDLGAARLVGITNNGIPIRIVREAAVGTLRYAFFPAASGAGYVAVYRR